MTTVGSRPPHAVVNALPSDEARAALERCCGAGRWVAAMLARRPFSDDGALYAAAEEIWGALGPDDFLEAFAHHPRIGEAGAGARTAATRD